MSASPGTLAHLLSLHNRDKGTCSCGFTYGRARGSRERWQQHLASVIAGSQWVQRQKSEAKARELQSSGLWEAAQQHIDRHLADTWDEGYQRGIRDQEQDVYHGADNPYRQVEPTPAARTD